MSQMPQLAVCFESSKRLAVTEMGASGIEFQESFPSFCWDNLLQLLLLGAFSDFISMTECPEQLF